MLSEETASTSLMILKEGAVIATEIFKILFPKMVDGVTGLKNDIGTSLKKMGTSLQETWDMINPNKNLAGEVSRDILAKQDVKIQSFDLKKDEFFLDDSFVLQNLKDGLTEAGILFSVTEGKDRYNISFKEMDMYKAQNVFQDWKIDMTEYAAFASVYGKDAAQKINWKLVDSLNKEEKQAIIDHWDNIFKAALTQDRSAESQVYEEAWRDSSFKNMDKEAFKNMDVSKSRIEFFVEKIKESIPARELEELFIEYEKKNIIYIDDENVLHNVSINSGRHYSVKCENPYEAKEALLKTNSILKKFEQDLESKYSERRGFSDIQRSYLRECMYESMVNPKIDISYFDNASYPVQKMAAIKECQEKLSKDNFNKLMEHVDELPADTIWNIATLNERDYRGLDIGELLDKNFTKEEINALKEVIKEGGYKEMYDSPEFNERFEGKFQRTYQISGFQKTVEIIDVSEKEKEITKRWVDVNDELSKKRMELEDASPEEKAGIEAEIHSLVEESKECESWLHDYQLWKNVQAKKEDLPSINDYVEKAVEQRINEQDKADNAYENIFNDMDEKAYVDMNKYRMEANIEKAAQDYYTEITPVAMVMSEPAYSGHEQSVEGKKFTFQIGQDGNVSVWMKGNELTMDEKYSYRWEKSKTAFVKDGKEYRQVGQNEKGKVYATKEGKTLVKVEKRLSKSEVMQAQKRFEIEKATRGHVTPGQEK